MTRRIAILLGLLLTSGCSGIYVTSDYDTQADFDALETYSWRSEKPSESGDPRLDNSLLDGRIRKAVDAQLAAKGYERREAPPVDFQVTYHTAQERKLSVDTINDYYGPGWGYYGGGYARTTVNEYEEGSLLIDIVDPNDKKLLWRGSAEAEIYYDSTPDERTKRINMAVEKVLEQFPPK